MTTDTAAAGRLAAESGRRLAGSASGPVGI
jgi:hypothetical protein